MKHLGFWIFWFGTRGSEVQILSPRSFFLAIPQITCAAFAARFFGDFGHIRSDFPELICAGERILWRPSRNETISLNSLKHLEAGLSPAFLGLYIRIGG